MFLQALDLTTALRPTLSPDETLLFVQDHIGIYEGKFKVPELQNGHAYLTTHRACYVDDAEPRKHSVAIHLKSVEKYDLYAGFLKSSPKITFYPKESKKASNNYPKNLGIPPSQSSSLSLVGRKSILQDSEGFASSHVRKATWVCPICSYVNPVPANFDPAIANSNTALPPCLACGIKPPFPHVLKAAISAAAGRKSSSGQVVHNAPDLRLLNQQQAAGVPYSSQAPTAGIPGQDLEQKDWESRPGIQCSRCTFVNHASMLACELCGIALIPETFESSVLSGRSLLRPESPEPSFESKRNHPDEEVGSVKFSFRAGGEKVFYERLKSAMTQRKWLLQSAPPIPAPINGIPTETNDTLSHHSEATQNSQRISAGIAGLERRGLELRKKNEAVIGSAFSDLDALRASAKEIIALAESFAAPSASANSSMGSGNDASRLIAESARALDMVTTKDITGNRGSSRRDNPLYYSEMSRNLAEYLTDDARGVLKREGGIVSLVDVWALYNRARSEGGVDLVSPEEVEKAVRLWEKLRLPVRLRQFRNGLMVVQQADRTDDKTIAQLLGWLQELHQKPPIFPGEDSIHRGTWDWETLGRGVTAQETAQHFGWSIGVAKEELEMAEEKGALCRDGDGAADVVTFWENWINDFEEESDEDDDDTTNQQRAGLSLGFGNGRGSHDQEEIMRNLRDSGLM